MRVTNGMTINNLMVSLNKNMVQLNKLQYQASTGNKIQFPSDDPIVAGRALKFRTNVAETDQFITNAKQASSWMQTSEMAYKNVEQIILRIQELSVQAASDTYTTDDRKNIVKEIEELTKELSSEINVTYAGRYVFSGFRTDEPPVFATDNKRIFTGIQQDFKITDIQNPTIYLEDNNATPPTTTTTSVERLLLPYTVEDDSMNVKSITISWLDSSGKTASTVMNVTDHKLSNDPDNPYDMTTATEPRWIKDTGEVLLPDGFLDGIKGMAVKEGEDDELVTLDASEKIHAILTVNYDKTGFKAGEINPVNYFSCTEMNTDGKEKRDYSMDNQITTYELGTNNKVQINNLAKDVLTPQFLADLKDICRLCGSVDEYSTEYLKGKFPAMSDNEIADYQEDQLANLRDTLHSRFSQLLPKLDNHLSTYTKEYTELGARMNRIDFILNRLQDDRLNFIELRDDNELVNIAETMINLTNVSTVYQSALSTGANIIQKSLVDFI